MAIHHFFICLISFFCGSVFTAIIYAIVSREIFSVEADRQKSNQGPSDDVLGQS
jgi:hypothetical protein